MSWLFGVVRDFNWSTVVRSGVMGDGLEWMRYAWRSQNWFDWTGSRVGTW